MISCAIRYATEQTTPIITVVRCSPFTLKKSGILSDAMVMYSLGSSTVCPFRIILFTPLNISIPARVTMKGGILTKAIQNPCHIPASNPTKSPRNIERDAGRKSLTLNKADDAPTIATTEPTDRSICPPVSMHSIIPTASISI